MGFAQTSGMLDDFKAYQLAKQYYFKCKRLTFPEFLQGQLLRASSSTIALGSLRECQALLDIEEVTDPEARDLANQLGAILYTLSGDPVIRKNKFSPQPSTPKNSWRNRT